MGQSCGYLSVVASFGSVTREPGRDLGETAMLLKISGLTVDVVGAVLLGAAAVLSTKTGQVLASCLVEQIPGPTEISKTL
jgi:hypothetical protein